MNRFGLLLMLGFCASESYGTERVVVGTKNFNERYMLAEVVVQLLERAGYDVERCFCLGGALICYDALKRGEIDVCIEYTGTSDPQNRFDLATQDLNEVLAPDGVQMLGSFGSDNTYALAMKRERAQQLGVSRVSDIGAAHREQKVVVGHAFLQRLDG